jgi:hypothetical protein
MRRKTLLRLSQVGNRVHLLFGLQVDYLQGVIAHGRHEKTLAFHVAAKVINAPFHVRQGNPGMQRQHLRLLRNGLGAQNEQCCEQQNGFDVSHLALFLAHRC